jgi:hypothetical protein
VETLKPTGLDRVIHQLAEEEDVAVAERGQLGGGSGLDRRAERLLQEKTDVGPSQRLELQAVKETVFPQGHDRFGGLLGGAQRDDEIGLARGGEVVDEAGRERV